MASSQGYSKKAVLYNRVCNKKSKNNLNVTAFRVNITHTEQVYACFGTPITPMVNADR